MQTILFTVDEDILERVADNDQAFEADLLMELEDDDVIEEEQERPKTADRGTDDADVGLTFATTDSLRYCSHFS